MRSTRGVVCSQPTTLCPLGAFARAPYCVGGSGEVGTVLFGAPAHPPHPICSHVLLSPQITMRNVNPEYAERCGLPGRDVTVAAVLQVTPFLEDGAKAVRGKETFRSAAVCD